MAREDKKNPDLEKSLKKSGIEDTPKEGKSRVPVYQQIGDSRIPVTKAHGSIWKSRRDAGKKKMEFVHDAWREAVMYYFNTAEEHRNLSDGTRSRSIQPAKHLTDSFSEVENIVFANTTALVPLTYSKNPTIEVTATKDANEQVARVIEKLCNTLIYRKSPPNFPIKNKMRRAVVLALLASCSYIEVGWTKKDQSSQQALEDLTQLAQQLEKAKTTKDVLEIEGKLAALENAVDLLRPEGPYARLRLPWEVIVDPASTEEDLSDARWIMIEDMIPTSVILARYAKKGADGKMESIYKPSHVLNIKGQNKDGNDELNTAFTILGESDGSTDQQNYQQYGFENKMAYDRAQFTHVQMVWDRTTRRVLMYNNEDWTFPIWVWDDPFGLDSFFPIAGLHFQVSPTGGAMKGEVSFYLDQQDAVNEINSEKRMARRWAQRNLVYNSKRIDKEQVDRLLSGDRSTSLGIPLNEGEKIGDIITALIPPSMQFMELFDKTGQMQAIDRLSSVSDVLRGAQFKTNTTEDAVETYNSVAQTRLDEKIDAVEDFSANIMWMVAQLCLQFMPAQAVADVIGQELATLWKNYTPTELQAEFSLQVVGGSVVKPNAATKKRQAAQVGQILGQFASASPVAFLVALKVFERAFDEVVITEEDWQLVREGVEQQLQGAGGGGGEGGGDGIEQIASLIDSLPPEAKQAIGAALAKGAPVRQIIERVVAASQQGAQPTPQGDRNATGSSEVS